MSAITENVIEELQAGTLAVRLDDYIRKIGFAYGNVPNSKMPKPHNAQVVITMDFSSGNYPDQVFVESSVKAKIPEVDGRGNAVFKKDSNQDVFFINPRSGEISINPIMQDDAEYQVRAAEKVTPINKTK